jgi:ribosomal protein S18 acetylase RimI-like enzyme
MTDFIVRKFEFADRESLLKIGADTAFFGEPIEAYLDDRQLFNDAFYSYYTDLNPKFTWVACSQDQVIGFLAGCIDTKQYEVVVSKKIVPFVLSGLIHGKYHLGKRSFQYLGGLIMGYLLREFPDTDLGAYPAHLHINIDVSWRGFGLGKRLIQNYLEQLSNLKIPGVHLHTTSQNKIACVLYKKMGFNILSENPDRFWTRLLGKKIENRCYGLKLQ